MSFFSVAIFCLFLLHGLPDFDCAIIGSPAKQNLHNIVVKNYAKTTHLTPLEIDSNHADPPGNNFSHGYGTKSSKDPKTSSKMAVSPNFKSKTSQTIHPSSNHSKIHNEKTPEDIVVKNEVPKAVKKYHHFTIEELRQRRKELREKWQARHALIRANNLNLQSKHSEEPKIHVSEKLEVIPTKQNRKFSVFEHPHQHHVYEQVTPRTRRILEHKEEEETLRLPKPYKSARLSAKTSAPLEASTRKLEQSTFGSTTESAFKPNNFDIPFRPDPSIDPSYWFVDVSPFPYSSSIRPEPETRSANSKSIVEATHSKMDAASVSRTGKIESSEDLKEKSRSSDRRQGDIRPFGYGPYVESLITPLWLPFSDKTPANPKDQKLGVIAEHLSTPSMKPAQVSSTEKLESSEDLKEIIRSSDKRQGDIRPYGYGPYVESLITPLWLPFSDKTPSNPKDSKLGAVAEHPSTSSMKPASDDVVSVKIEPTEPSAFAQRQYTVKTNTAPFYRNMTFQEKFQAQNPILIPSGKSAETEESVGGVEKTKMGKKNEVEMESHEVLESAEDVDETLKGNMSSKKTQIRHGKRSSEHTTSSPGGSAMKIAEDPHVYQDWRENIRKAVRERLREMNEDSE